MTYAYTSSSTGAPTGPTAIASGGKINVTGSGPWTFTLTASNISGIAQANTTAIAIQLLLVARNYSGGVYTSTNGTSWSLVNNTGAVGGYTWAITYNTSNSSWALSGGTANILISTNSCSTFTSYTTSTGYLRWVAYGSGYYVTGGDNGGTTNMAYSSNGTTWTNVSNANTLFPNGCSIGMYAPYLNIWVAIGKTQTAWSSNATTWTAGPGPPTGFTMDGGSYSHIGYNDAAGLFVVGNQSAATPNFMYSIDGKAWTARSNSPFGAVGISNVYYSPTNNLWVATGNSKISTSSDSITWSTPVSNSYSISIIIYVSSLSLWIGTGSGGIYTSPDLTTWTVRQSGPFVVTSNLNG